MRRLGWLLLGASLACAPREVPVQVEVITETCSGASPMADVTHFQFRIEGEGIDPPIERVVLVSSRRLELPSIPAGLARTVEVRGFAGDPAAVGRLVSHGRSVPFDVPAVMPLPGEGPPDLSLFLRRVDGVTGPSLSIAPGACTHLARTRAGHTATLLQDGRVLIAGGYSLDPSGIPVALSGTELFDPRTGIFTAGPELGITNAAGDFNASPRAFHAAALLQDGRVLLSGGERYDSTGAVDRYADALIFDPARDTHAYALLPLRNERAHHAMGVDLRGRVLIVGGLDSSDALVSELEWWAGDAPATKLADQSLARVGMSVSTLPDGAIAIAGGRVSTFVTDLVQFFVFDDETSTFTSNRLPALLGQARREAPAVPFGAAGNLAAIGGFGTIDEGDDESRPLDPLASSELITTGETPTVEEGPAVTPRGALCAIPLGDGRVVTIGGRTLDPFAIVEASDAVEVMTPTSTGTGAVLGLPALPVGRHQHTCTLLQDGSVLVTGGVFETSAATGVLDDAWLVTPRPID